MASVKDHSEMVKGVTWIDKNDVSKGLVTVSHDQTGIVWEWEEGSGQIIPKIQLRGHERGIDCISASPNSTTLATGG